MAGPKGISAGNRVILNDGSTFSARYGERLSSVLMRVLEGAYTKLGHVPSLDEAKTLPYMPVNMDLYDEYYGSYYNACKEFTTSLDDKNKRWVKAPEGYASELELLSRKKYGGSYVAYYHEQIKNRKEGVERVKKSKVDPERYAELLETVIDIYHDNKDRMPSARQLKRSQFFDLGELWSMFGNYDNLCKVVEEEIGCKVVRKKNVRKKEEKQMSETIHEAVDEIIGTRREGETDESKNEEQVMNKRAVDIKTEEGGAIKKKPGRPAKNRKGSGAKKTDGIEQKGQQASLQEEFMDIVKKCSELATKVSKEDVHLSLCLDVHGAESFKFELSLRTE